MALILSRRVGQSIVIDGRITITVTRTLAGEATLAIEAPKEIRVDRKEIHERRQADKFAEQAGN